MISGNEKRVLECLVERYDASGWGETGFFNFQSLMQKTGLDKNTVRKCCRSLKRKKLADYSNGLWYEDGGPAGSGYCATLEGAAYMNPCDHCEKLCEYEWYERDGKMVCVIVDDVEEGTHHKMCEEHYRKHRSKTN